MANKKTKKESMSTGKMVAIGAGVAAAGAGAYYFLGPKGKKHQHKAKVWVVKMEKEVAKKAEDIKDITVPLYHKTVDNLAKTYSQQYKEHSREIEAFAKHLKSKWEGEKKQTKKAVKKASKAVKKSVKNSAKKVVKKVAPKKGAKAQKK